MKRKKSFDEKCDLLACFLLAGVPVWVLLAIMFKTGEF